MSSLRLAVMSAAGNATEALCTVSSHDICIHILLRELMTMAKGHILLAVLGELTTLLA
jgi:hypothetical protein